MENETLVTEEPLPGWLRFEKIGEKPWFKTPIPRTVIRSKSSLKEYLEKEHKQDRKLDVDGSEFSFKRRLGLKHHGSTSSLSSSHSEITSEVSEITSEVNVNQEVGTDEVTEAGEPSKILRSRGIDMTIANRLVKTKDVLDHRKLLSKSSKAIDSFRINDGYTTPATFDQLKERISLSSDLRAFLTELISEDSVVSSLDLMFSDCCLMEISRLKTNEGPLVEFPGSVNSNVYCDVVEYGMKHCPRLLHFVVNMVTRRGEPVLPSHVLKCATLLSSICYAANHELDALVKLRSLTLQVDGLNNIGLDTLSDLGLTQCARSLSNHRDLFAQLGPNVMSLTAVRCPYQSTIDNCDFQSEHLTVETIEKETIDTSHLSTDRLSKEEALKLFSKEELFLGNKKHEKEVKHLKKVLAIGVARILSDARPEARHLQKLLPKHHEHENSKKELSPALTFILKPYPYQETKNPDTIKLLLRLQRQFLRYAYRSPSFQCNMIWYYGRKFYPC